MARAMKIKVNGRQGYTPYSPSTTVLQSLVVKKDVEEKKKEAVNEDTASKTASDSPLASQTNEQSGGAAQSSEDSTHEATAEKLTSKGVRKRKTATITEKEKACEGEM